MSNLNNQPALPLWRARSYQEGATLCQWLWPFYGEVAHIERTLSPGDPLSGYSITARQLVPFLMKWEDDGSINWRETVGCPITLLSNRVRAAYHILLTEFRPRTDAGIYITEQTTHFYSYLRNEFGRTVGSEYLAGVRPGQRNAAGILSQDFTRLTFASKSFDILVTLDVLEHVPDYRAALRECVRVLRKGGGAIISVPFTGGPETTVRATISAQGQVTHLLEPEYHGDPVGEGQVLCYYNFGWSLLDDMREAGFADAYVVYYWSRVFGYLQPMQMMIVGVK